MGGRASIWDCELCATIGGVNASLGRWERERERERKRGERGEFNDFLFILEREFNDLMTWH